MQKLCFHTFANCAHRFPVRMRNTVWASNILGAIMNGANVYHRNVFKFAYTGEHDKTFFP